MEERNVDVAIIGSGSAGLNAMSQTRKAGKTFVLINGGEPGTTCARVGCMPSKAMIQVAEDYHRRTHLGKFGVDGHEALTLDVGEAMEHVQDLRDTFVDRVLTNSTDDMPEDLFVQDYARFIEPTLLEVAGQRIRAGAVVIATGSRPLRAGRLAAVRRSHPDHRHAVRVGRPAGVDRRHRPRHHRPGAGPEPEPARCRT